MAAFRRYTGLKSLAKIFDDARKRFVRNFVPRLLQGTLQRLDIAVCCSAGFLLQDGPNCEIHRIQIRRIGRPQSLVPDVDFVDFAEIHRRPR